MEKEHGIIVIVENLFTDPAFWRIGGASDEKSIVIKTVGTLELIQTQSGMRDLNFRIRSRKAESRNADYYDDDASGRLRGNYILITIPALLPIYDKLKMDRRMLATIVAAGAGTMNIVSWGGPMIRAATALEVSLTELYNPMILPQLCDLADCVVVAVMFGLKEKKRLGSELSHISVEIPRFEDLPAEEQAKRRPKLAAFNILLIVLTIVALVMELLPPAGCFMAALCIAMVVNYHDLAGQSKRMDEHAVAAMMMVSTLFGASCFTGLLGGGGMLAAMAEALCNLLLALIMGHIAIFIGIFAMPLSLMFNPDSFYYAVLPVLAATAGRSEVPTLAIGRAVISGQITVGFPISPLTPSTLLLTGLTGVGLGEHQKHSFIWLWIISLVIVAVAAVMGVIPI